MGQVAELKCVLCGRSYREGEVDYTCTSCGIDGTLDVLYDFDDAGAQMTRAGMAANPDRSLWRYWPVLPVRETAHVQPLAVGWTPIYRSDRLAAEYGVKRLYIKDDGRNPTASLKDRASAVGVGKALDHGRRAVACASTGNAASSLAGFSAVAGLESFIFVPKTAPEAKVAQLLIYGARVMLVNGTYEDAFNLSTAAIGEFGWYNRNCAINPYLVEGKKTCAMEISEQLDWEVPDWVFISVGDGCCLSGLYKGFRDLEQIGLIDRIPRLCGVQADGCRPVYNAFKEGRERVQFGPSNTLADSISVGAPRNWAKALRAARLSRGDMITVTDDKILDAMRELARQAGVFGEPAGVTGYAGFRKMAMEGGLRETDTVAVVVTGNGLKDIASARKACGEPVAVEPDLDEFVKALRSRGMLPRA